MAATAKSKGRKKGLASTEQLLQKQQAKKEEFFMAASHQLKAPLAIIQWCLQSVLETPKPEPQVQRYVSKALSQADAMAHLVTDMLHVFRLMRSKDTTTYVRVEVNQLIQAVLQRYQPFAQRHQVRLVLGAVETLPPVYAEPAFLEEALANLVDNAIKYTRPGGTVTISACTRRKQIEVEIKDEGIGIADADKGRLFTEFFRSASAQDMTHDGTGLGLVLVKQIVERYGGEVEFHSQLGKGSQFTIKLPVE